MQWKEIHQLHKVEHPFPNRNPLKTMSNPPQNKEYKYTKDFEARICAAIKYTQSYSGGTSGTTGSKVWFYPYCKMQKSRSVARV